MALKTFNPTSPGRRQLVLVDRSALHKGDPVKSLTEGLHKKGGRNNQGRITVRHQGGGAKRLYRKVDFKRSRWDIPAVVERLEYDPNRTAFIALIKYQDGELSYIIAPQRLEVGDTVITSATADIKPGNTLPLKSIPVGTIIHNIELKPQKGAQMVRSAGTYAQLVGRESGYAQIKLASGELRKVQDTCLATIGAVSNPDKMNEVSSKAGRTRNQGVRPTVRGVVMNPVDHPHGGGEGKSGQGNPHPVSPWGWQTKGKKTRSNKRTDSSIVQRRKKK